MEVFGDVSSDAGDYSECESPGLKKKFKAVCKMEVMSVSKARSRLLELHRQIICDHDQVILTHKSGNAVIISMDEWESYKETMRLLNDKKALKALVRSFEDHDAGKSVGKSVKMVKLEEYDKSIPLEKVMREFAEAGYDEAFLTDLKEGFETSTVYASMKNENKAHERNEKTGI